MALNTRVEWIEYKIHCEFKDGTMVAWDQKFKTLTEAVEFCLEKSTSLDRNLIEQFNVMGYSRNIVTFVPDSELEKNGHINEAKGFA